MLLCLWYTVLLLLLLLGQRSSQQLNGRHAALLQQREGRGTDERQ